MQSENSLLSFDLSENRLKQDGVGMVRKSKWTRDDSKEPKLLNAEEIAARRIPLEDSEVKVASHSKWHCTFCNKRFVGESNYMKHFCEPKRRLEQLKSPLGQAALGYYRDWMKLKKFSQPSANAFLESKFYRQFINFAQLVMDANISRPDRYMELMVEAEIAPSLWLHASCYALYLEWTDKLTDPLDQVQESINYLLDLCEKESVQLSSIFEHLGPQRVLSLVRQRRLTPWLLFCSPTFGKLLKTLDPAQLKVFDNVVSSSYWGNRFQTERATIENIKTIVKEVHL